MPPLRILHIGNGKAFKIKAIVDAFVSRGHELHLVSIPPMDGNWAGVTWHNLPEPQVPGQVKVLARMLQIRKLARRLKPDVVHAHNAWGPGWYGAASGIRPFVIHAYGGDVLPEQYAGRPGFQRGLTSWSCRNADRVVVTGRHMIDAAAHLKIPRDRLMLLPRGVDLDRYRPGLDTSALRRELGLSGASPVVFSPRYQVDEALYNLDVIVDAFVAVRQRFPGAVCVQMYDPAREAGRRRLEQLAAARGLRESYRLVPAVDNSSMPLYYNLADVVVSVPSSDGFPVTVLEAAACAAPLVVSELPYCAEWFEHGVNGLVVPIGSAQGVSDAVIALAADEARRARIGAAGRQLIEQRADYRRCMDELETVYRGLVAAKAAGRKDN